MLCGLLLILSMCKAAEYWLLPLLPHGRWSIKQRSISKPCSTHIDNMVGEKPVPSACPAWQHPFQSGTWPEISYFLPLSAGNGKSIQRVIHPPSTGWAESPLKAVISHHQWLERSCRQSALNRYLTSDPSTCMKLIHSYGILYLGSIDCVLLLRSFGRSF